MTDQKVTKETIAAAILAARQASGLTQATAAERVGVLQTSIASIEQGHYMPSLPVLIRMAGAYGVTLDVLVGRTSVRTGGMKS